PLTNAFVGEFMMFTGVFRSNVTHYNFVFAVGALITVILSAVYTLNMLQKLLFGPTVALTEKASDIRLNEKWILGALAAIILCTGVYPAPVLEITASTVDRILSMMMTSHP